MVQGRDLQPCWPRSGRGACRTCRRPDRACRVTPGAGSTPARGAGTGPPSSRAPGRPRRFERCGTRSGYDRTRSRSASNTLSIRVLTAAMSADSRPSDACMCDSIASTLPAIREICQPLSSAPAAAITSSTSPHAHAYPSLPSAVAPQSVPGGPIHSPRSEGYALVRRRRSSTPRRPRPIIAVRQH